MEALWTLNGGFGTWKYSEKKKRKIIGQGPGLAEISVPD